MKEPPTSTGKALLSRCFEHWCVLHHGHTADEIAAAFDQGAELESSVRRSVSDAARLIGELIAGGRLRTYARPIGGGTPSQLAKDAWE
ncbi:MAG: hypothetical protein M3Y22_00275, partial [Pseudomonadota bacterium]|nr:hypothetical protein [Pseudomonadota bacterium]